MRQPTKPYPRMARVNETLRHAIALELERIADIESELSILTVTGVECDPDLKHAKVYLAALAPDQREILDTHRQKVQSNLAKSVRLKRTPQLSFEVDPAIVKGEIIEKTLRQIAENHREST
jgi:ribosome-binding factor A